MTVHDSGQSRRQFLKVAAAGAAVPLVLPRNVIAAKKDGKTEELPPSESLGGALIGCGGRGGGTFGCLGRGVRRLASCDVKFKDKADDKSTYTDFRKVLDRKDIDVVAIATHPGWHALISIAAMEAGKDVVCEKPMCRFISEGRAVAEAEKRFGRVFQVERKGGYSGDKLRKLFEYGFVKNTDAVYIQRGGVKVKEWSGKVKFEVKDPPANLDWDLYCGPAPLRPYQGHRFGGSHRGYWDYENGGLGDMLHHHIHKMCYQFGRDLSSPIEITPYAPPMHPESVMVWGWCELKYADGFTLVLESREWGPGYDRLKAKDPKFDELYAALSEEDRKKFDALPDPVPGPYFEEAVRKRVPTASNGLRSHRVATVYLLANAAMRCGRPLKFDPVTDQIIGDEEANRLVNQPIRAPWRL